MLKDRLLATPSLLMQPQYRTTQALKRSAQLLSLSHMRRHRRVQRSLPRAVKRDRVPRKNTYAQFQ